ncbi:MAG: DNA primase [Chloroflexi bacterium]|nr:DNA primase [Chloroflexota bacterium]MBP8058319.1 DNA primase [Chloroflexota bacterium]
MSPFKPMSVTDDIKSRLDIVDVISEYVQLRKSGHSYSGFCPFHSNSRTPAFVVFPDSQTWRCFGACAEGGDVFGFLMKKEGLEFKEALHLLAERAGVTLEAITPERTEKTAAADRLTNLLAAATDYFHHLFLYAPEAELPRRYMTNRGITQKTLETFQIGFSLNRWDACRTHFQEQGYTHQELLEVGLLTINEEKGTTYDRFRNRLMFPIKDVSGRVVGFGARTLEKDGLPKYLNSPQTALFNKSHLLFGLDLAKRQIREARQAVIVEGYMDMIQAWQAGYNNVIAQMGTALTPDQLNLLKRFTKRFILALDSDAAGDKATLRGLEVARETLDHETEIRFDSRGLLHHEGRLQADIRVVTLPEGDDPDSFIRREPQSWPALIEKADPVVAYVIRVVAKNTNLNDAKEKVAAANRILPLIQEIPNPVERDHYRQLLARTLKVDERSLQQLVATGVGRPVVEAKPRSQAKNGGKVGGTRPQHPNNRIIRLETNYLTQCLRQPQVILSVNQKLLGVTQSAVTADDFSHAEDRQIVISLWPKILSLPVASIDELWDSLEDWLRDRVQSHLNSVETTNNDLTRLPETLTLSVLEWRAKKLEQLVAKVQGLCDEASKQNEATLNRAYLDQVVKLMQQEKNIHQAMHALSAFSRRKTE